jgi:uncharacterized protein
MGKPIDIQKSQNKAQLQTALARWDNEGGAGSDGPQEGSNARPVKEVEIIKTDVSSIFAITSFFVLTIFWSWLLGFIAIYTKPYAPNFSMMLSIISGFGPSIAALVTVGFFGGRKGLNDWLKNALNWRVGWHWYVLAFFMPPLVMLLAQSIHWTLGGTIPTSPAVGHIPLTIANFGLVFLIGGPLGEEFGWRSYAVTALGSKIGWRSASLIIGVIWGLWHLPWFFTAGTAQFQMSLAMFMLNILAGSVLFSWLFLRSKGSVIPALVAHTSLNAFAGILSIVPTSETSRAYALVTGIMVAIAVGILLRTDGRKHQALRRCK